MRNNRITSIALIFMLIGVFLQPDYVYSANISHLRVPIEAGTCDRMTKIMGKSATNNINDKNSSKVTKLLLAYLITRDKDFDWKANKNNLPSLKGYRIGITDTNGSVSFSPFENYSFRFNVLGFKDPGWEVYIIDNWVKNGIYEFTVELTKEGKTITKTFQIGRFSRILNGQNKEIGNTKEVLEISEELGKIGLSDFVKKDKDFDWKANKDNLPSLKGYRIGITDTNGSVSFSPFENYSFRFNVLGFNDPGWEVYIIDNWVKNGIYEFTVELTKEGKTITKTFQMGRFSRILNGQNKETGNTKEVLEISEEFGKIGLSDFVKKGKDFDWKANKDNLPSLKGYRIGPVDKHGSVSFSPFENYPLRLNVLGFEDSDLGWEAYILNSGVKNGIYEVTVICFKKDKNPITKTFQMGRFPRILNGQNKETGNTKEVLEISEELGKIGLSDFVKKGKDFDWKANKDNLPSLKGYRIGITDTNGSVSFSPFENYPFRFNVLGSNDPGWEVYITDNWVKNGIYEFTVICFKKDKNPVVKTFQIGRFSRILNGHHEEMGNTKEVLEISEELGTIGLSDLVKKGKDFDWKANKNNLPSLKGYRIGITDTNGSVSFSPFENYPFTFNVLGFKDPGWEVYIIDNWVKNGIYEFTVELTKEGKTITKTFQIGGYTKILKHRKTGDMKYVLDIIDVAKIEKWKNKDILHSRKSTWNYTTEQREVIDSEPLPDEVLSSQDIEIALKRISIDMTLDERKIMKDIKNGEDDEEIAIGYDYPVEWIQAIRRYMQNGLKNFRDPRAKYSKEIISPSTVHGSPAQFFITLYDKYRGRNVTLKMLRDKLNISESVADRDTDILLKSGLIAKEGKGDEAVLKTTLKGVIIIDDIFNALKILGPRPTINKAQNAIREILLKYGGELKIKPNIIFPKGDYELKKVLEQLTTDTDTLSINISNEMSTSL